MEAAAVCLDGEVGIGAAGHEDRRHMRAELLAQRVDRIDARASTLQPIIGDHQIDRIARLQLFQRLVCAVRADRFAFPRRQQRLGAAQHRLFIFDHHDDAPA